MRLIHKYMYSVRGQASKAGWLKPKRQLVVGTLTLPTTASVLLFIPWITYTKLLADLTDSWVIGCRRGDKLYCRDISTDHKPEMASEKRRIEAAGGEVVFNGCHRIQHEDVRCLRVKYLHNVALQCDAMLGL